MKRGKTLKRARPSRAGLASWGWLSGQRFCKPRRMELCRSWRWAAPSSDSRSG